SLSLPSLTSPLQTLCRCNRNRIFLLRLSAHNRRRPPRRTPHTGTPSDISTCDCMPDRLQFPLPATTADSAYCFPYVAKLRAFSVPQNIHLGARPSCPPEGPARTLFPKLSSSWTCAVFARLQ